jgi:hypothetical protein
MLLSAKELSNTLGSKSAKSEQRAHNCGQGAILTRGRSSRMGRVDIHPPCFGMSGKERTYRTLGLYEWQIKDLVDRGAGADRARRGTGRAGTWHFEAQCKQTRERIACQYG